MTKFIVPLRNFSEDEALCNCGCGKNTSPSLMLKVQALIYRLEQKTGRTVRCIITDVRYLNEAKWIKDHDGVLIYLNRPGYKAVSEEEAITIQQILGELEPLILVNDGTKQQLEEAFRTVMRSCYNWR